MSSHKIRCPECERIYYVQNNWIPDCGVKFRCEGCGRLLWIEPPRFDEEEGLSTWSDASPIPMSSPTADGDQREPIQVQHPESPSESDKESERRASAPEELLDRALRRWAAGREVKIRQALAKGEFLASYGLEFSQFLEAFSETEPPESAPKGRIRSIGWVALERLRTILEMVPASKHS
ncbi:MAG: zinc-ribbon domain-containing protein [Candidatus Eisenbacteria bacterium]|uniref:Zinc-ribbon domain-containing protein n=1 Tax=Eiseniibacteriota bacterium TaxID=2212470 RepID=A0A948RZS1_UNCEI|nr:zinc-ribbon domain-containing protein [Candidatus Eisenbacteria bacterium]MBU1949328.1 zinc-ribbon domain-containing protein [Candidatus Eisenbacteria bacterium]MBU2692956.1 zinc-ribbon domain-containing protein [Candidatus Eisenbacteria bacterium]